MLINNKFMKYFFMIFLMVFVTVIIQEGYAENPYEIIASLDRKYVEWNEEVIVTGHVKNFNPDYKNMIRILETDWGKRIDYDTIRIQPDNSFQFSYTTGWMYDSKLDQTGVHIIKMNYGPDVDNWTELEFVYCDKRNPSNPEYLENCQEAYGQVPYRYEIGHQDPEAVKKSKEAQSETPILEYQSEKTSETLRTKFENGMEYVQKCSPRDLAEGKSGSQCSWVESDRNYFNRIIIPLIFNIILVIVIIAVIVVIILKLKNRKKNSKSKYICGYCDHTAKSERDLYEHSLGCEKYQKEKNSSTKPTPLEILKERYAKGEITKEEFDKMKSDIED